MPTFYHSGDLGDIIYALPLVRHYGDARIVLGPCQKKPPFHTRETMTEQRANLIRPLLDIQPYVKRSFYSNTIPKDAVDLNQWRLLFSEHNSDGRYNAWNLSTMVLEWHGLPHSLECEQWLTVDRPISITDRPVVIARSQRYHNADFDWRRILNDYADQCVFVGLEEEFKEFVAEFDYHNSVMYHPTANILELARVIAGSELFVGNQSCPFAIAEGLKHPAILEWYPLSQNCHFVRPNLQYGYTARSTMRPVTNRKKINWVGLWDSNSGLGQVGQQILKRINGIDVLVVPTRGDQAYSKTHERWPIAGQRDLSRQSIVMDAADWAPPHVQNGDILFSMWETTQWPPKAVEAANRASLVIVPSAWCAETLAASGCTTRVGIVPLGIDPEIYHPGTRARGPIIRFGVATRQLFCNRRKKMEESIEAFVKAFPGDIGVELVVKGYDRGYGFEGKVEPHPDPRIKYLNKYLLDHDMADWYRSLDFFINLASGGGWELHLHEAMACGCVPIAMPYSSCTTFFSSECGIPVDYDVKPADWDTYDGLGDWAFPRMDSIVEALKKAREMTPSVWGAKAAKSVESAMRFTWANSADVLKSLL